MCCPFTDSLPNRPARTGGGSAEILVRSGGTRARPPTAPARPGPVPSPDNGDRGHPAWSRGGPRSRARRSSARGSRRSSGRADAGRASLRHRHAATATRPRQLPAKVRDGRRLRLADAVVAQSARHVERRLPDAVHAFQLERRAADHPLRIGRPLSQAAPLVLRTWNGPRTWCWNCVTIRSAWRIRALGSPRASAIAPSANVYPLPMECRPRRS